MTYPMISDIFPHVTKLKLSPQGTWSRAVYTRWMDPTKFRDSAIDENLSTIVLCICLLEKKGHMDTSSIHKMNGFNKYQR